MTTCEFLYKEVKKSCVGCRGWFCKSTGRKKKLSDISICQDDHTDCVRYLAAHPELGEEIVSSSIDEPEPEIEVEPEPEPTPEPEPEEEVIELPPTKEVTTISGADFETIKVAVPTVKTPPRRHCPYLGSIPVDRTGCCGYWCYANDTSLNVISICKSRPSWRECLRRHKAIQRGVKHAGA